MIDHYEADVQTVQDYYPFGMLMPERTGYQASGGWAEGSSSSTPKVLKLERHPSNAPARYEATELIEFTDNFESRSELPMDAVIVNRAQQQGEGGEEEGSGAYAGGGYRYGFNGKENDNEVKGEGNQQDYGMRIYDPRIGKFLSVDPLTKEYPELTPYQFASNRPIDGDDLDGLEYNNTSTYVYHPPVQTAISDNTSRSIPYKEMEIMMSNGLGTTYIGPKSIVEGNVALSRRNYYNAVGANIANGPGGAIGYLLAGDQGSFVGASADGIAFSFAGVQGNSRVLSKPSTSNVQSKPSAVTESASYEHSPVNLIINLKSTWNKEQEVAAYNKAQAISDNPETMVTIKNPMPRPANLRTSYLKQGGTLKKGDHVDHVTDLQINGHNGADGKTNLQGLNGSVNTSFGSQIYQQIRNLPDNTKVNKVAINPFIKKE